MEDITFNLKDWLECKFKENKTSHDEILKHQKHTNGDVTKIKIWSARVMGAISVIVVIMGFVSTFYFIERGNQNQKFEQVIKMQGQINNLAYQLSQLELID